MPEFARVSTFEVGSGKVDDAVAFFNDTDLAGASAQGGFRRGFWLLDRSTGSGTEVLVFESRDALDASSAGESDAQGGASAAGVTFGAAQTFEVVAEGKPGG